MKRLVIDTCFRCCEYLDDSYRKIAIMIRDGSQFDDVIEEMVNIVCDLLNNKVTYQRLIIGPNDKNLKSRESFARMFNHELKKAGNDAVLTLDQPEFVLVKELTKVPIGNKTRAINDYIAAEINKRSIMNIIL